MKTNNIVQVSAALAAAFALSGCATQTGTQYAKATPCARGIDSLLCNIDGQAPEIGNGISAPGVLNHIQHP